MLVDLSLRNREYAQALGLAEDGVAANPKDYRAHLWLAQVRWAMDVHSAEVEPSLRQAVALAGDSPEAQVALVQYLARSAQLARRKELADEHKARAEAEVARAERKFSRHQHALALAQCYAAVGQTAKEEALYEERLTAEPRNADLLLATVGLHLRQGQVAKVKARLHKLVALAGHAPEQAASARRLLWFLEATGGDRLPAEALAAMGIQDVSGGPSHGEEEPVEDLRVKALVLALQGHREARTQAVRILEAIPRRQPLEADDQLLLARLYESLGDWPRARGQFGGLLSRHGEELRYLAQYALSLLKHDEVAEAQRIVERMERLPEEVRKGSFELVGIKARALTAQGKGEAASKLLLAYAKDNEPRTGGVAALLEELKQHEAAEAMYRRLVSVAPSPDAGRLVLAQFLARRNRLGEALDLCEKARAKLPPERVAQISVLVLYAGSPTEHHCERVVRSLEAALLKAPGEGLLLQLAAVRNLQRRFDETERLYRQVLRQNDRIAVALNNLAFLLTFQDGKAEEAEALIGRAIALRGPLFELLDTRGLVHLARGRADLAVKDLEKVVVERPSAGAFFHLALACHRHNQPAQAQTAFARAQTLGLKEKDLHPLEGPAYRRLRTVLARD
jgi:tetratricopeptide (TPR) repeat protein